MAVPISETIGPILVPGAYADFMAADASFIHVIRCFVIVNTSALSNSFDVSIGAGANQRLIVSGQSASAVPAHDMRIFRGRWHIPLNTAVQFRGGTANRCTLVASGYVYQ